MTTPLPHRFTHTQRDLAIAAGIVLLTMLAYLPAFHGGWHWDDGTLLVNNRSITLPNRFASLWIAPQHPDYFPMTETAFWLEWRLWGNQPAGYLAMAISLHTINALLLWQIFRRLSVQGAALAALLFAIHPLTVESVAWISELKNTLSFFFLALSLLAWLAQDVRTHSPRALWYTLSVLLFILATLSKTSVVMFPIILLLIDWWQKRRLTGKAIVLSIPFFLTSLTLGLITMLYQRGAGYPPEVAGRSIAERLAQAGTSIWFYLYKSILPIDLVMIYPEWKISRVDALAFAPLLAAALVAIIVWRFRKASWGRAAAFGLAVFAVNLLPVLGLLNMAWLSMAPVADHFAYLSLPAATSLIAASATRFVRPSKSGRSSIFSLITVALVIALLVGLTFARCRLYRNTLVLWSHNFESRPQSPRVMTMVAKSLYNRDQVSEAIDLFERSLILKPNDPETTQLLGDAYFNQSDYHRAYDSYMAGHHWADAGRALWALNQKDQAFDLYGRDMKENPSHALVYRYLGDSWAKLGNKRKAAAAYHHYTQLAPDDAQGHNNLATALLDLGDATGAASEYRVATTLDPENAHCWFNLGAALWAANEKAAARQAFNRAVALDPSFASKVP